MVVAKYRESPTDGVKITILDSKQTQQIVSPFRNAIQGKGAKTQSGNYSL